MKKNLLLLLVLCGQYLIAQDNFETGVEAILRLDALEVSDFTGIPKAGLAAEEKNNWSKALEIYWKALHKEPNNGNLWLYVALIEYNKGEIQKAILAQERGAQFFPDNPEIFHVLADLYLANLQPKNSVKARTRAFVLDPNNLDLCKPFAQTPLSIIKSLQELKWEEAVKEYQVFLKAQPEKEKIWEDFVAIQSALGQFDEAIVSLNQAIKAKPRASELHYYLANLYRITGKKEEAWQEIQLALQFDAYNIELWQNYRLIAQQNQLDNQANLALERILFLNPQFKE